MNEEILNKLKIIADRLDSIDKLLQFINSEREIIEDNRTSLAALKQMLENHREHIDHKVDDVKSDIQINAIKTEEKLDETQEKVEDNSKKINEVKKAIS